MGKRKKVQHAEVMVIQEPGNVSPERRHLIQDLSITIRKGQLELEDSDWTPKSPITEVFEALIDMTPQVTIDPDTKNQYLFYAVELIVFYVFSIIGWFLAPTITVSLPPEKCILIGCAIAAPIRIVVSGLIEPYINLHISVFINTAMVQCQGALIGAGLAHLETPIEPFVASALFLAFIFWRKNGICNRKNCFIRIISCSFLYHIVFGFISDSLTPFYFILVFVYTISALIPIQLSHLQNSSALMITSSIPIIAKALASWAYGTALVEITDKETCAVK